MVEITMIAALYLLWKSHIRRKAKRRRVWVHSTIQRQMSINPPLMCVLHFTIVYTLTYTDYTVYTFYIDSSIFVAMLIKYNYHYNWFYAPYTYIIDFGVPRWLQ